MSGKPLAPRVLAKAEAFVQVQCAWHEAETLSVTLDGSRHEFAVQLQLNGPPSIT